ncbi:LTA synthase family protein [Rurimicrobium arvi]|uniref:LTA synthase family protein n=1 Tax=Rurimicrobium arvi TaxID=2049916 RepID=A0ABP8MIL2_9BACT
MKNKLFVKAGQFSFPLRVFLLGIAFFTVFRLIALFYNLEGLQTVTDHKGSLLAEAFLVGFRFDALVMCFVMSIPFLTGSLLYLAGKLHRYVLAALYTLTGILFIFCLLVMAADMPFLQYFCKRINDTIFNWNNAGGFGVKMIFENIKFCVFAILYLGVLGVYIRILRGIYKDHVRNLPLSAPSFSTTLPVVLGSIALLSVGMKGRFGNDDKMISKAFFSPYGFVNQLSLNPVYNFCTSYFDRIRPGNERLHWMSDSEAQMIAQADMQGDPQYAALSPVARMQHTQASYPRRNVVLVLMESMAAHRMKRYGNRENLTPFLDSLAGISYCFDSTFSSGIHTYNGIYSTIYGHPALMNKHMMDVTPLPQMDGLSTTLKKQGYQTVFFLTHNEAFDNMHTFLLGNGYDSMIGQKDYPESEVLSAVGVPDEYMYRYSMPLLGQLYANHKPFLATFMSGSNHAPYFVPENIPFRPHSSSSEKAVVEYADWSLRKMMEYASKQPWYDSTIFVFIADHGVSMWNDRYEVPFSLHHIPFMIYVPGEAQGKAIGRLAVQTDLYPTIMGLVGSDYINTTFGIDVMKERHNAIVYSSDDILTCMNDSLLYVYHSNGRKPGLFKYRNNGDLTNYMNLMPDAGKNMETKAFARLQCSQSMVWPLKR